MPWDMRKITSPEQITSAVDKYIQQCEEKTTNNIAAGIKMIDFPRRSGFAEYLDISLKTLKRYETEKAYENLHDALDKMNTKFINRLEMLLGNGFKNIEYILKANYPQMYKEQPLITQTSSTPMPQVSVQVEGQDSKALTFEVGEDVEVKNEA